MRLAQGCRNSLIPASFHAGHFCSIAWSAGHHNQSPLLLYICATDSQPLLSLSLTRQCCPFGVGFIHSWCRLEIARVSSWSLNAKSGPAVWLQRICVCTFVKVLFHCLSAYVEANSLKNNVTHHVNLATKNCRCTQSDWQDTESAFHFLDQIPKKWTKYFTAAAHQVLQQTQKRKYLILWWYVPIFVLFT